MILSASDVLLQTIGQSLVDTLDVSVLSDVVIEATPEFAGSIWKAWDARADYEQKRQELQALAGIGEDAAEDAVEAAIHSLGLHPRGEQTESVFGYLRLVPGAIRRFCRRPANPLGTSLPTGLPLYGSWDLLPLLPARMPKFQPGDRPWNIGDWELRELIELTGHGEIWQAVNPRQHDRPPVALHFVTEPAARRHVRDRLAGQLDRVLTAGRLPGVVPLQALFLFADPPCLQRPYLQAADLTSLVREARESGKPIEPLAATDLVLQIAQTLGRLHALAPAIVHRDLRGANILLMTDAAGRRRCLLANVGLSMPPTGEDANPYASAEQLRDDPPRPVDDIYALGVLWYQLLEGDLNRARPGGSSWRRRLVARGLPTALVEVLESCFDDDPASRPADGTALAEQIRRR